MKNIKKFFIIILSIFGLISCEPIDNEINNPIIKDKIEIQFNNEIGNIKFTIDAIKFKYNNHNYIFFSPCGQFNASSVTHDPDCPCLKQ